MDTKLTIKLNREIIEAAKMYAKSRKISLSKIIEAYLHLLIKEKQKDDPISPLVQGLSGVIELPDNIEFEYYLQNIYNLKVMEDVLT